MGTKEEENVFNGLNRKISIRYFSYYDTNYVPQQLRYAVDYDVTYYDRRTNKWVIDSSITILSGVAV